MGAAMYRPPGDTETLAGESVCRLMPLYGYDQARTEATLEEHVDRWGGAQNAPDADGYPSARPVESD